MTRNELEAHHRRYIDCLNERRLDEAEAFYADELLYNGATITRTEWRRIAIEDSFAAMPDLRWHVEHLVIEGRDVFARLRDTGTLRAPFAAFSPTGRLTSFGEHVLYRFRDDGRTDEVWSVVDLAAMRRNGGGRAAVPGRCVAAPPVPVPPCQAVSDADLADRIASMNAATCGTTS